MLLKMSKFQQKNYKILYEETGKYVQYMRKKTGNRNCSCGVQILDLQDKNFKSDIINMLN